MLFATMLLSSRGAPVTLDVDFAGSRNVAMYGGDLGTSVSWSGKAEHDNARLYVIDRSDEFAVSLVAVGRAAGSGVEVVRDVDVEVEVVVHETIVKE